MTEELQKCRSGTLKDNHHMHKENGGVWIDLPSEAECVPQKALFFLIASVHMPLSDFRITS